MNIVKYLLLAVFLGIWTVIAWFLVGAPTLNFQADSDPIVEAKPNARPQVDPHNKAKFDRIRVGMTLKEVEAIVGPVGSDYSSLVGHGYHIWKSKNGWLRVYTEQGKVTKKQFDPQLSVDDRQAVRLEA